jgi:hypothetical protein
MTTFTLADRPSAIARIVQWVDLFGDENEREEFAAGVFDFASLAVPGTDDDYVDSEDMFADLCDYLADERLSSDSISQVLRANSEISDRAISLVAKHLVRLLQPA